MFELRPYQAEAKQAILSAWDEGYRKTLLVLPTGCGKTVVFSSVTENQVNKGHRVLIMAHRGELLDQAADKLKEASGLDSVLEKAESSCLDSFLPVTVGSVQSLAQEKRLARFPNDYFQDIIVDEAHHCLSDSYRRILDHFPTANILGVTATPDRGDMKNLGEFFDSKAYVHWICRSKKETGMTCSSVNFSEEELKNICADVLETDSFDEEIFESRVKDIIVLKNGDIEFHLVGGETRRWKNLHLNPPRHKVTLTDAFQGKIRCAKCGNTYHRVNSANKWVYWYCMGKKKKGMTCDNINYTDFQLRQITAHILGLEDFDEQVFSEQIEGITVLEDGNLEYHFYKGRTERWQRV